jgi:hypothetical protein
VFDQGSLRARFAGRSYWRLRYADGKVVSEWDCDWSEAPRQGRQSLRLYCPNGQTVELGNDVDATGRLFQLKVALLTLSQDRNLLAHLIGIVDGADGWCRYAAWDYRRRELITGHDNVNAMRFENLGQLALENLGVSVA